MFDDGGEQGGAASFVVRGYCREGHAELGFELRAQRFGFVRRELVRFVERAYYGGFARAQLGEPLASLPSLSLSVWRMIATSGTSVPSLT